jgi:hypothetical protein
LKLHLLTTCIVFLPLNPEEFTTSADCRTYSALLVACRLFCPQVRIRPDMSARCQKSRSGASRKTCPIPVSRYLYSSGSANPTALDGETGGAATEPKSCSGTKAEISR